MTKNHKTMKIIWAVDPFVEDKTLQLTAALALRSLSRDLKGIEIEPVYSIGRYQNLIDPIQPRAQEAFERVFRRVSLPDLEKITVLANSGGNLRETVDQVIAYAKEEGAGMIVASTRARKGPQRWMTGSFAESLILRSDIPLLIVNSHSEQTGNFKHILFATDFSDESKVAFNQVVGFAAAIGGRITVYHKISYDMNPGLEIAFAAYPPFLPMPPEAFDEEVLKRKGEAQRWADFALAEGVFAEAVVDGRLNGTPAESILRFAKKNSGLIAMAAHSGPVATVLLGSTTRQVVRASSLPVWIVHTPAKKKAPLARVRELRSRKRTPPLPFTITEADIMDDLRYHGRKRRKA